MNKQLHRRLLHWYDANGRRFPWRLTRSPYRILVAEIMLQQTQAARVVDKWRDFLRIYPGVRSLAAAPLRTVIVQWDGLGYNNRALRLHECAQLIAGKYSGRFPASLPQLLELPGIGPYTASALLCFAFGLRVPVVDVNVRRVVSRIRRETKDTAALMPDRRAWEIAEELLPQKKYYEWNQALMDLGATICTARSPRCDECPVSRQCRSARSIASRQPAPSFGKSEPMCGSVPRRLVRGAIVRYIRRVGRTGSVSGRSIAEHLRRNTPGVTRQHVRDAVKGLIDDGLLVRQRKSRDKVSFP